MRETMKYIYIVLLKSIRIETKSIRMVSRRLSKMIRNWNSNVLLKVVNEENAWIDFENPCENLGNNQDYRENIKELI